MKIQSGCYHSWREAHSAPAPLSAAGSHLTRAPMSRDCASRGARQDRGPDTEARRSWSGPKGGIFRFPIQIPRQLIKLLPCRIRSRGLLAPRPKRSHTPPASLPVPHKAGCRSSRYPARTAPAAERVFRKAGLRAALPELQPRRLGCILFRAAKANPSQSPTRGLRRRKP